MQPKKSAADGLIKKSFRELATTCTSTAAFWVAHGGNGVHPGLLHAKKLKSVATVVGSLAQLADDDRNKGSNFLGMFWRTPATRLALLQLQALSLRVLADDELLFSVDSEPYCRVFSSTVKLMEWAAAGNHQLAQEVVVLAVRMDVLPAAVAVLAALRRHRRQHLHLQLLESFLGLIGIVVHVLGATGDAQLFWSNPDHQPSLMSLLHGAIVSSGVLEQAACTLVQAVVQCGTDLASAGGGDDAVKRGQTMGRRSQPSGPGSSCPDPESARRCSSLLKAFGGILSMFASVIGRSSRWPASPYDISARSAAASVVSGPCFQYSMAAHVVAQLAAADGGTLYGLAAAQALSPAYTQLLGDSVSVTAAAETSTGGRANRQRRLQEPPPQELEYVGMFGALSIWNWCLEQVPQVPLRPLSRGFIRHLALRTAIVATASCRSHLASRQALSDATHRQPLSPEFQLKTDIERQKAAVDQLRREFCEQRQRMRAVAKTLQHMRTGEARHHVQQQVDMIQQRLEQLEQGVPRADQRFQVLLRRLQSLLQQQGYGREVTLAVRLTNAAGTIVLLEALQCAAKTYQRPRQGDKEGATPGLEDEEEGCGGGVPGDDSGKVGPRAPKAAGAAAQSAARGRKALEWWVVAVPALHVALSYMEAEGLDPLPQVRPYLRPDAPFDLGHDPSLAWLSAAKEKGVGGLAAATSPAMPAAELRSPVLDAALAAGFIPLLERTLRAHQRHKDEPLTACDMFNLPALKWPFWGYMLVFGDPIEVGSLLATMNKLAGRCMEPLARPSAASRSSEQGGSRTENGKYVSAISCIAGQLDEARWWLKWARVAEQIAMQLPVDDRPAVNEAALVDVYAPDLHHQQQLGLTPNSTPAPPRQLCTMTVFAIRAIMPHLAATATATLPAGDWTGPGLLYAVGMQVPAATAFLQWLPALLAAYAIAQGHLPPPPQSPGAAAMAADLGELLLKHLSVVDVVGRALRFHTDAHAWRSSAAGLSITGNSAWDMIGCPRVRGAVQAVKALQALVLLFPQEVAAALRQGRIPGLAALEALQSPPTGGAAAGAEVRVAPWLAARLRELEGAAEEEGLPPAEVATGMGTEAKFSAAVNAGQGTPAAGSRASTAQWASEWVPDEPTYELGAQLLAGMLEIRQRNTECGCERIWPLLQCCNPGCRNLEGDSELSLRMLTCNGCGVVWYCSKACQREHWRAGHQSECGRGADR